MATAGDLGLEQTLENLKLKGNEYLQNQTPQTEANLSEAMSRQASALADSGGMVKQSQEMRMAKKDFEKTTDQGRKFNIAHKLAETLVSETLSECLFIVTVVYRKIPRSYVVLADDTGHLRNKKQGNERSRLRFARNQDPRREPRYYS